MKVTAVFVASFKSLSSFTHWLNASSRNSVITGTNWSPSSDGCKPGRYLKNWNKLVIWDRVSIHFQNSCRNSSTFGSNSSFSLVFSEILVEFYKIKQNSHRGSFERIDTLIRRFIRFDSSLDLFHANP